MLDSFLFLFLYCKRDVYLTHFSNDVVSSKPPIALNCHLFYNLKQMKDQSCSELVRKKYMLLIVKKKESVYRDLAIFSNIER